MNKVVEVDFLDNFVDSTMDNCVCSMARLQRDNQHMTRDHLSYLDSVYDDDNLYRASFILRALATNPVGHEFMLLDKLNSFLAKHSNDELLPLLHSLVTVDELVTQFYKYEDILQLVTRLDQSANFQMRV